jgi:hypothetical protein
LWAEAACGISLFGSGLTAWIRQVQRGQATLFSFDPKREVRGTEVKKTKIEGVGILPYSLTAQFENIDASKLSDTVLVCTTYFDEQGSKLYNKAFLYRQGDGDNLDQLPSPSYCSVCR